MSTYANSIGGETLSYEKSHRCDKLRHWAKDCSKPRICGKCRQKGHVEKNCDTDIIIATTTTRIIKEKQQKYRSVCKRCGQKGGHSSSRCRTFPGVKYARKTTRRERSEKFRRDRE